MHVNMIIESFFSDVSINKIVFFRVYICVYVYIYIHTHIYISLKNVKHLGIYLTKLIGTGPVV